MEEYYMLTSLCKMLISYSLCSRVKSQNQNKFQLNLSEDEIRVLVDLIDKRLEELTDDKEKQYENN